MISLGVLLAFTSWEFNMIHGLVISHFRFFTLLLVVVGCYKFLDLFRKKGQCLAVRAFFSFGLDVFFVFLDMFCEMFSSGTYQILEMFRNNCQCFRQEQLAYTYSDIFAKLFHSIYLVSSRRRRNLLLLEQLRGVASERLAVAVEKSKSLWVGPFMGGFMVSIVRGIP
jgi:hypothetical protein